MLPSFQLEEAPGIPLISNSWETANHPVWRNVVVRHHRLARREGLRFGRYHGWAGIAAVVTISINTG